MSVGLLAAALATAAPQPTAEDSAPHPAIAIVDSRVPLAKRRRRARSGIEIGLGSAQVALGLYGMLGVYDRGPAVKRIAIKQVVAGGVAVVVGTTFLLLPSGLETLQDEPEYRALVEHPDDPVAARRFEAAWAQRANSGRTLRLVEGVGRLGAGVGVTTWAAVSLALQDPNAEDGGTAWAMATANAGLLLVAGGLVALALKSPVERALEDYRLVRSSRPVVVTPTGSGIHIAF